MKIKILGSGCPNCKKLYANTQEALADLGVEATIEKVEEMDRIIDYGVMKTPALVIDEQVKAVGKVLGKEEIKQLILQAK